MPEAALGIYVVYLTLAFGVRTAIHLRRTGSTGFHGVGGRVGSPEWLAGVGFVLAIALGFAGPLLDLTGALDPVGFLDQTFLNVAGAAIALIGLALTLWAQLAMGASWRIGVDPGERTELVTSGPFSIVRNPIFAAMIPTAFGLALMVPNAASLAGLLALVISLELQVRIVEEPYLLRTHPAAYPDYAARVGRFVPAVGRVDARR